MGQVCNVKKEFASGQDPVKWGTLYRENEKLIESGSAFFVQAFAEALGVVSDIELHDVNRAQIRLAAIAALLGQATKQYNGSMKMDDETGLGSYHESTLRKLGLDVQGVNAVLTEARGRGFVVASDDSIHRFATIFHEEGYRALMKKYLGKVSAIETLVATAQNQTLSADMWQDLGWRLTSSFAEAMDFGQCLAVMNAAAYR